MKVKDLFYLLNGVATSDLDISSTQDDFYNIPFLRPSKTALKSIAGYVSSQNIDEKYIFEADSLYVSTNGQGSHTYSYVYPVRFSANSDVSVLVPKREMTLEEKLFYATVITSNRYKFSYGRKPKGDRLLNLTIPEYQNSINYEREREKMIVKQPMLADKLNLDTKNWEYFNLEKLFEITGSQTTSIIDLQEYGDGIYPYITTQATNNGIDGYYDFFTEQGDVLTVDSAVLGFCFYQSNNFSASDHVEKLIPKFDMNKYVALFLVTIINMEQFRYNYGRKCSQSRMKQRSIKLPTKNGQPDWQFMENYIKSLPYSKSI